MYLTIYEFIKDWSKESDLTLRIFEALTDKSLNQKVWEEGRTLGRIAWHLVQSVGEAGEKINIEFDCPPQDSDTPEIAAIIAGEYDKSRKSLMEVLPARWKDENLVDELQAYGQTWTGSAFLESLIRHQIHHRGQMTVLMRQAGIMVPGVAWPSKEEWARWGMQPDE